METLEASGWNLEFIWTLYWCKLSSICSVKSDVKVFIPSVCLYMFHSADPWLSSLYHLQGGIRGSWLTDRINPTVLKEAKRGIAQISAFHTIMRPFMFREKSLFWIESLKRSLVHFPKANFTSFPSQYFALWLKTHPCGSVFMQKWIRTFIITNKQVMIWL